MPKITIDDRELEFKDGQTILQAALDAGIDIPYFCWHPKLSVAGNCRICLVEVEKMPKLAISCSTKAGDGMVVHTKSEKALDARRAVMEFILINHPLDCPICDEAGECKLQDYAYHHSVGESRFTETKNKKRKRDLLGPRVMFDAERCISCSRCIRFVDEIAGKKELTFAKRGDGVTIVTYPGRQMDNPYSMNTIDICPVGALTSVDFRFKARVWDMASTKTVCAGCARGCNVEMWTRSNEIMRLTPRDNEDVNGPWMCDEGRLSTFNHVNASNRIDGPMIRRDGELRKIGWAEAFADAASELKAFSRDEIGFVASGGATMEDNYLLGKFAAETLYAGSIALPSRVEAGWGDDILRRDDRAPNATGAKVALSKFDNVVEFDELMTGVKEGRIKALYVLGEDVVALKPELKDAFAKLTYVVAHAVNENETTAIADLAFPNSSYAEQHGSWMNFEGRVQRIRPAVTTLEADRALDGMSRSRLDKFGTRFDRWGNYRRVDARPGWRILAGMSQSFESPLKYDMAEKVFEEMAREIDALSGLNYDDLGELGVSAKTAEQTA
jgi:NADH-quinone oxidoreductase subunit G